eukprot:3419049-Prymnesium_polylepis.1
MRSPGRVAARAAHAGPVRLNLLLCLALFALLGRLGLFCRLRRGARVLLGEGHGANCALGRPWL